MAISLTLELADNRTTSAVVQALSLYRSQLQTSIRRSRRKLAQFEKVYGVSTDTFLNDMAAEDLPGGDLEYIEWAGEARLLEGLEGEIEEIERVQRQL
ncbi:MAG: hypothetical protein HY328_09295 [Chloroflexi bacterium]|nr:hypothetical protein [Chloroflexota bacterium]